MKLSLKLPLLFLLFSLLPLAILGYFTYGPHPTPIDGRFGPFDDR